MVRRKYPLCGIYYHKEVTLNYDKLDDLLANAGVFNGATVGRYNLYRISMIDMQIALLRAIFLWMV